MINHEKASAIVHLDMPSVIRDAEQRVGRVDRMDSPYETIDIYWPDDAEPFSLKTDELFVERHQTVADLLGSNFGLPESLEEYQRDLHDGDTVSGKELSEKIQQLEADDWDGIEDAFTPVRRLFKGGDALIDQELYEKLVDSAARVVSHVGLVESDEPWAYFALSAEDGVPRWIMFDEHERIFTKLSDISEQLRDRLGPGVENLEMTETASEQLDAFAEKLRANELQLLPDRKRRALQSMRKTLGGDNATALRQSGFHSRLIRYINRDPNAPTVDLDEMARRWLVHLRPVRRELVKDRGRTQLITIQDCTEYLQRYDTDLLSENALHDKFDDLPRSQPATKRVAVAILGMQVE